MPEGQAEPFVTAATSLSKGPLGIITLFIILTHAFASLLLGVGGKDLGDGLKAPLVWFLVLFPVLVLCVFAWLVACHHTKLYSPTDFKDQKDFLELQKELRRTQRRVDTLAEGTPGVAIPPLVSAEAGAKQPVVQARAVDGTLADPEDPQRGQWGGQREANHRVVSVEKISRTRSDPNNFRIQLQVRSTDAGAHPLTGQVEFHLHDTFRPQVEVVDVKDGVARLTLYAYGAFTVGARTADGTTLEINLADDDIDAPREFKDS